MFGIIVSGAFSIQLLPHHREGRFTADLFLCAKKYNASVFRQQSQEDL